MNPEEVKFSDILLFLEQEMSWNQSKVARLISLKPSTLSENLDKTIVSYRNKKSTKRLMKLAYVVFSLRVNGYDRLYIEKALSFPVITTPLSGKISVLSSIVMGREIEEETLAEKGHQAIKEVIEREKQKQLPMKKLLIA